MRRVASRGAYHQTRERILAGPERCHRLVQPQAGGPLLRGARICRSRARTKGLCQARHRLRVRSASPEPPPQPQTLPELAKSLPALEQATTGHSSDLGTFWNSSLNWGLPFLGDQGRLDLGQLAVPDWVAGHPAALMTVRLFGSVLFSFIAVRVIDWLAYIASEKEKEREQKHLGALPPPLAAIRLTIIAVHAPLRVFLIIHASLHASSVLFNFLREQYTPKADSWPASMVHILSKMFHGGDMLADKAFQVMSVIFVSWVALRLKDRWVQRLLDQRARTPARALSREIDQVLLPMSSVISWVTVVASFVLSLSLLGINLMPLATAGLGSGVVLGFASQSVLANVVAGCNLLVTRPLVVGDRVTLQGAADVVGVVERVDFTRTIIRDDFDIPISVPNKLLTDAVILNESRTELSPVREHYGGPRQLKLRLKLRSSDLELAPDLIKDVKRHLITKCDGVDVMLPVSVCLASAMEDHTTSINITINATALAARSFLAFRQRVILEISDIVREHGARPAYSFYGHLTSIGAREANDAEDQPRLQMSLPS